MRQRARKQERVQEKLHSLYEEIEQVQMKLKINQKMGLSISISKDKTHTTEEFS